ncbi:MAG: DUF4364 family protein [Lachnospiraceae bacterium]|nr:DUF4364 family protein [Lachnospiraceae bacterium]
MAQEAFTLYKLIILYMLEQTGTALTNAQISDFILEKEYTNYFTIQSAITDLEKNNFITVETIRNSSHIRITKEGSEVLGYCVQDISSAIKDEVNEYLKKNRATILEATMVVSDYYQLENNEYVARGIVKDGTSNVMEINLNVATEEEAVQICDRWKDKSQEIYAYLIQQLLAE